MDEEELGRKIQAALRHLQVVGGVLVTIAVLLQARAPRAMCNVRGRKGLLSPTGRFHLRMPPPPARVQLVWIVPMASFLPELAAANTPYRAGGALGN